MNKKTTANIIRGKITKWIKSIHDSPRNPFDKGEFEDAILVSGGCIATLLTGEETNDFDIYLKDMDVLAKLMSFYGIEFLDGRKKEELLRDHFSEHPEDHDQESNIAERTVFIRNLHPEQIKLDVMGHGSRTPDEDLSKDENGNIDPFQVVFISQNALSLSGDIQIVTRFTGDVEEIHKNFDFIHATNYFTIKDGLVLNIDAVTSLLTKTLYYQGSLYPLTSIIRMKKFILRGWRINAGEILKIMFQISQLDLEDIDVLEEQLIGVDVAYFSKLIEVLRGDCGSGDISANTLSEEIDKIFNEYSK